MSATSLSPGDIVAERYRIVEQLGEGGMGTVFHAIQLGLDRGVALKVLRPERDSDNLRQRFVREAKVASVFRHPGSVEIYDFGDEDGLLYLVMELLLGETLQQRLMRLGVPALQETVDLMCQLAATLAAAHELPLVHRDLKPENIFVLGEGEERVVKIVDFGLAFIEDMGELGRVTRDEMISGTPEFLSPEQATAQPIGPPSDIYSLGVMFYLLLTGRLPFRGAIGEVLAGHVYGSASPLDEVRTGLPRTLVHVAEAMLGKRPEERPTAAQIIVTLEAVDVEAGPRKSLQSEVQWDGKGTQSLGSTARRRGRNIRVLPLPSNEGQPTAAYDSEPLAESASVAILGDPGDALLTALAIRNLTHERVSLVDLEAVRADCILVLNEEELAAALATNLPVISSHPSEDLEKAAARLASGVAESLALPLDVQRAARKIGRVIARSRRDQARGKPS